METDTEDQRSARHPTLASSWDAACGALDRSLRVLRAGALSATFNRKPFRGPSKICDLVILRRSQKSPDEKPCFLSLSCDPSGGEGIVSVGILSSARNMEVYLGEEYCGTSRGRSVGNVLDTSEHEKIILYKKCLKLESAAHACKIKVSHCHSAWPGHVPTPSEGGLGGGMGEPPACSYLEKILSKNLELMERRLTDYLDERLRALQEHVDGKVALLAHLLQTHLLQSPGSPPPPPGMPLTRYDSGDRLSNGER
ncbi:PREDICTED: uncharacterized protein C10orf88 homolog [Myotis brandtii]|uniref:uncharacterized protein C10orf88 homolog n=1 Tax=Myotis brandtii TaxID=109478 RepID=UPI0007040981|nr:PREDICTED: uncharacterized protein C10orf88 homolog [Myotis brandtii]